MAKVARRRLGRPPNTAHATARRRAILAAAQGLFALNGYASTDVQAVADRLGLSKGTIYLYFTSKEDLFLTCVDDGMSRLLAGTRQAAEEAADPVDAMQRGIHSYLAFFEQNPWLIELIIHERAAFKDRRQPTYFAYRDSEMPRWREMHVELIRQGRVRRIPVDRILDICGNLLYGTVFTNHFASRRKSLEEQAEDVIDILFAGILTPAELAKRTRKPAAGRERA